MVSTVFDIVDNVSEKLEAMTEAGNGFVNKLDEMWNTAINAFKATEEYGGEAAQTIEEKVNMALDNAADASERARVAWERFDETNTELTQNLEEASEKLYELEGAGESTEKLAEAMDNARDAAERMNEADNALNEEFEKYSELVQAVENGTVPLTEQFDAIGEAEKRVADATKEFYDAQKEAKEASDELGKSMGEGGDEGVNAISAISTTLAAAGITKELNDIASAAYELVTAFSEAESTVVNATGATGQALDGLMQSTMSAYAAAKNADLDSTAGAIGEINTRMGLVGDELTDVTGKFLDFASITGTDAVGSVQKITKVMNQWGIEGSEVESVMDKLAYAGQISGASVDNLAQTLTTGAASFQNAGLSIDNTIAMLADFELAGINSTTAITGMRTAVTNFSKNGIDAQEGLQQTIERIQEMGNSSEATALAVETFGSRAGQQLALAIQNGVISADTFTKSMDDAQGCLEKTAEASQTLDQKWQQANNNISAAFTNALQPTLDKISGAFAGLMNGVGTFLNEHPAVTKAITAIGIGVGALVAGITGFVFITKVAIPALQAFGGAMNAALGPIGWIAMGISAATIAITAFAAMMDDTESEVEGLTTASREQYYEVQNLTAKYDEAVEKYGETSDEALRLANEVDRATEAFENNKRTIDDVINDTNELCDAHDDLMKNYNETYEGIRKQELGTEDLIKKLKDLSSTSTRTAGAQEQMKSIVAELDEMYPSLSLGIKDVNEDLDGMVERIEKVADAQNKTAEYEASKETYAKLVAEQSQLEKAKEEAWDAYVQACDAFDQDNLVTQSLNSLTGGGNVGLMDETEAAYKRATAALNENIEAQEECTRVMEEYGDMMEGTSEQVVTSVEAVSIVLNDQQQAVEEVAKAYEDAFNSALTSVENQYSIWEKADEVAKTSADDIKTALDSQISYWNEYSSNMDNLTGRNIKHQEALNEMIKTMDDGSAEGAAAIKGLASASDAELEKIAKKYEKVQEGQKTTADRMADLETDYSNSLNKISADMESAVEKMSMENQAQEAAKKTLTGYINGLKSMQQQAASAAEAIAQQTNKALAKASTATPTVPGEANGTTNAPGLFLAGEYGRELIVPAHAAGATNAEPFYIAGEEGPELIYGRQGSTVFPHSETEQIISAIQGQERLIPASETSGGTVAPLTPYGASEGASGGEKRIVLEIQGGGEINVGKGADKESILSVLQDNLRPVLLGMINDDIMEEGDLAYDF